MNERFIMDIEKIEELADGYGVSDAEALFYYCENFHLDINKLTEDNISSFNDVYVGIRACIEDYAEELVFSGGMNVDPSFLIRYFDFKSFANDLIRGGDIWTEETDTGVYVYLNE